MAPLCYVIMGLGKKTDLATGRDLNLDQSYKSIIKPAVQAAGYQCIRADEVQHSGLIDVPMYKLLYEAELVVADLSTTNPNAIFELGVRHALKPRGTIVIAESKFTIPFDATHIAVRRYEHLGSSIDYDEAIRMQKVLTDLIAALPANDDPDSPVYTMLPRLHAPSIIQTVAPAVSAAVGTAPGRARATAVGDATAEEVHPDVESYEIKVQTARDALNEGAFAFASKLFLAIYREQTASGADGKPKPARPFVVQQLALATYKAGEMEAKTGGPEKALAGYAEAERLLVELDVETTTDPETLGLWSAIHKRRAEMPGRTVEERKADIDKAISAVERGFVIKRDPYNGTNLAYLLNLRASLSSADDRIADNVSADRIRKMVVQIGGERLTTLGMQKVDPAEAKPIEEERYWIAATKAESLVALGDPSGPDLLKAALATAPAGWMADETSAQLDRLLDLLAAARTDQQAVVNRAEKEEKNKLKQEYDAGMQVNKRNDTLKAKRYYVSYAWADSDNPDQERYVDDLCEDAINKYKIDIIRDKNSLHTGDVIYEFMRQLGAGDRVFIFLSEKYLHSPYCMFELLEIWRNSKQNEQLFISTARVFILNNVKIDTPEDRIDYSLYWSNRRSLLEEKMSKLARENIDEDTNRQYGYMVDFTRYVSTMLALFAGRIRPRTFDEFVKNGFSDA